MMTKLSKGVPFVGGQRTHNNRENHSQQEHCSTNEEEHTPPSSHSHQRKIPNDDETTSSVAEPELVEISLHESLNVHEKEVKGAEGVEMVLECAKVGDLKQMHQLFDTYRVDPNVSGFMGWSAAHWAAREGHIDVLEYLRTIGANLNALDSRGDTLLHKAAANGKYRVCRWLLENGSDFLHKNQHGLTALDVARECVALTKSSESSLCEASIVRARNTQGGVVLKPGK